MKLAEALQERADINRKIEQLKVRLNNNVLVQEGEKTAEDPDQLKQELDRSIERLAYLMARINKTNCETEIDGQTLTEIIARKDALSLKIHLYKDVVYAGSQASYRARNTEIKIKSAISVAGWQAEIDGIAKELRLRTTEHVPGFDSPENGHAPTAHECNVINHCYYQTLGGSVRVGKGKEQE